MPVCESRAEGAKRRTASDGLKEERRHIMAHQNGYKILVVEDDANERTGLQRLLADAGY